jgi:hypothetical protein
LREKIIENWLINASERGFQVPFAFSLIKKGHRVIHVSRHCAMELGKDVISQDNDGKIHAFQLKSKKKISLSDWRKEINNQVFDLVNLPIKHPSILQKTEWHESYLVVNGELEEEVIEVINKFNDGQISTFPTQNRILNVVVLGDLMKDFLNLESNLWPSDLKDEYLFIELLLSEGKDVVPVKKIVKLLESLYDLENVQKSKKEILRLLSSGNLLISLLTNTYIAENNYYSEYLCWGIQLNFLNYFIESGIITHKELNNELDIVKTSILNSLENLYIEVSASENFLQDSALTDVFVVNSRRLITLGLCALRNINNGVNEDNWLDKEFSKDNVFRNMEVWGESALVYLIMITKYFQTKGNDLMVKELLVLILEIILLSNEKNNPLPNPYYNAEYCLLHKYGSKDHDFKESFKDKSYFLEIAIRQLVDIDCREYLESRWNAISKIGWCQYYFEESKDTFLFRSKKGKTLIKQIPTPTSFRVLKENYSTYEDHSIPNVFKTDILSVLNLLVVYPHRCDHNKISYLFNHKF